MAATDNRNGIGGHAMNKVYRVLPMIVCLCTVVMAGEGQILKRGILIGELLPQLNKYGKPHSLSSSPEDKGIVEKIAWKIGQGSLVAEITIGAGIVRDLFYALPDGRTQTEIILKVKEVNLADGEMTIILPNSATSDRSNPK
jgi:hypothetical protein